MSIELAQEFDFDIVKKITHKTIKEIYPHYYPYCLLYTSDAADD